MFEIYKIYVKIITVYEILSICFYFIGEFVMICKDDILYVYKEQWFTGFAPCFYYQLYSLACCKGQMRRNSIRHKFNKGNQNIWILSVAGKNIAKNTKKELHNTSKIKYAPGDLITLVKVKDLLSWKEYSEKYFGKRADVIYTYDENSNQMQWHDNPYHNDRTMRKTDCGDNIKDYANIKQIVISDEYYLFKENNKVPQLFTTRNFTFDNSNIDLINDYMKSHPNSFEFCGRFIDISREETGCGKK